MKRFTGTLRVDLRSNATLELENRGEVRVVAPVLIEYAICSVITRTGPLAILEPATVSGIDAGSAIRDVIEIVIVQHPGVEIRVFDLERLKYTDPKLSVVDGVVVFGA